MFLYLLWMYIKIMDDNAFLSIVFQIYSCQTQTVSMGEHGNHRYIKAGTLSRCSGDHHVRPVPHPWVFIVLSDCESSVLKQSCCHVHS